MEYGQGFGSPDIFLRWAGIATIAAALERKVWTLTSKRALYPNLYIILVGPPGVGKSMVMSEGSHHLFSNLEELHVAPTNVSSASFIDALAEADRRIVKSQVGVVSFNSMIVYANELGTFLPAYDGGFMSILTDIWDGKRFDERKRTRDKKNVIERPCLNLIAGTTPGFLTNFLPEGAWDQGFLSRCNLIYSGEIKIVDLWREFSESPTLTKALVTDLKQISELYGPVTFPTEVRETFMAWLQGGGEPRPGHPKLAHYNTRRAAHLLKLCMVASVSRGSDLSVTMEDFQTAQGWLFEAEAFMPDIFKAMNSGGDSSVIKDLYYQVFEWYVKGGKKAVDEYKVIAFLSERVPAHSVARVLENMVRGGLFKESHETGRGKCYTPQGKSPHT